MAEELDLRGRNNLIRRYSAAIAFPKIAQQSNADIGANVASGSYPADAMIVIPAAWAHLPVLRTAWLRT
jgi:4-hydroxy-3-polyprenylbenzoate decarboxylase